MKKIPKESISFAALASKRAAEEGRRAVKEIIDPAFSKTANRKVRREAIWSSYCNIVSELAGKGAYIRRTVRAEGYSQKKITSLYEVGRFKEVGNFEVIAEHPRIRTALALAHHAINRKPKK